MENTPGTPHLLTDVRFSVSRKGYNPDEVDNFLERVSAAVAQLQDKLRQSTATTEAAEARAADAVRNEGRLHARIAELESGSPAGSVMAAPIRSVDPMIDAEAASSILVMAQRTADATINEARTTAAQMMSESEVEASRILAAAKTQADEAIRDLDKNRRELAADNAALNAFLSEQRAVIAGGVSRIQAVLDDPAALRVGTAPVELEAEPAVVAAPIPVPATIVESAPVVASEPEAFQPIFAEDSGWNPEPETDRAFADEVNSGPATSAVPLFDDDFLAEDDDDADAAMRRFFDADFDDDHR
ncbi:MAG: DivIVA domain-containing protein [Acidimicrobiales bacterium]